MEHREIFESKTLKFYILRRPARSSLRYCFGRDTVLMESVLRILVPFEKCERMNVIPGQFDV